MKRLFYAAFTVMIAFSMTHAAGEQPYPAADSPHFLYVPDQIDPAKTYWVVVGVHGAGGRNKGANGMAGWVDKKDNVIVLGPKFSNTYQNADAGDQQLLIGLFEKIKKEYKVHPKMFIYGFSGGSQFAHRFVMKQPDYVCGVSSHSGGSWGTDSYGTLNDKARHIPFAISCGEKDTGKAWPDAPYNRLDWYKRFENLMDKGDFFYRGAIWTNVGHNASGGVREMTEECFQLATTGILKDSELAKKLVEVKELAESGQFDEAQKLKLELEKGSIELSEDSGWHDSREAVAVRRELVKSALAEIDTSPAARRRFELYGKCVGLLKSGSKPDASALLMFMQQCPPAYWKGRQDSRLVFDACNAAAGEHVEQLREQRKLNMQAYKELLLQWDGLAVREELLKEYDAVAEEELKKVLAMQEGSFKQRALKSFISQWQIGSAVDKARAALED